MSELSIFIDESGDFGQYDCRAPYYIISMVFHDQALDLSYEIRQLEYKFEIEVTGFLRGNHTERYCRNGEEIGDKYKCTYGCPVNEDGYGICSKTMMMLYTIMEAVRSGGDLENIGGSDKYCKDIVCPDGCVVFRLTAKKLGKDNFFKGKYWG